MPKYDPAARYASWKFGPIEWSRVGAKGDVYMHRLTWNRLRLHLFWRGDGDDPHDHPWGFTTFPIWPPHGYIEEFVGTSPVPPKVMVRRRVPAWRPTSVPATHCHRVLFPANKLDKRDPKIWMQRGGWPMVDRWPIITLVWRHSGKERQWGFLVDLKKWVPWREYLYGEPKKDA